MPANLFYSTGIPVCIIILKKCRKHDKILFINASSDEHYEKGKRQNYLRDEDVEKIVDTYQFRKEEPRFSRQWHYHSSKKKLATMIGKLFCLAIVDCQASVLSIGIAVALS